MDTSICHLVEVEYSIVIFISRWIIEPPDTGVTWVGLPHYLSQFVFLENMFGDCFYCLICLSFFKIIK